MNEESLGTLWRWVDPRLARSGDGGVVVGALLAGVSADLAVRSGGGLSAAILVFVVAAAFLVVGRPSSWQSRGLFVVSATFGGFLALRSSPWLVPLDVLAIAALLVLGASLAGGGSIFDLPLSGLLARVVHALVHGVGAPAFAVRGLPWMRSGSGAEQQTWMAVLRGLGLAVPLLVVLGALLGSADILFARAFDFVPDLEDSIAHAVLIGLGAWGMAGLVRVAAATPPASVPQRFPLLGGVEATVVLTSVIVLFAGFAVTQIVALAGGGRHVVETAGLTYAEYARSGFFQLVAVAAIALAVLLTVDAFTGSSTGRDRRRLVLLSEVVVALTLVVVVSALRRLDLYENAYGLTMLRLYAAVFVGWTGVSLLLLGAWILKGGGRAWFPTAAVAAGLVVILALNIVNPEAVVVRRNVALAEETGRFDPGYVLWLSDDAVPEMVRTLPRLPATVQANLLSVICSSPPRTTRGWAAWNAAHRAADDARRQVCPTR
ncbi:MAG TPA: DUF4173 domain-containing protein [Acidimicrobiia bacterium]|nr:DUF4173 domain-containing protein [Acidimicrobiia bacterium]